MLVIPLFFEERVLFYKKLPFTNGCFFPISREKSRIKEEIMERRKKKLLLRHRRQKYLEEADLQEAERLQELDRSGSNI